MTCPVCGGVARVLARPHPWTYLRCTACGTYSVAPMPEGDAVADADAVYTDAYYAGTERARESLFEEASRESSAARVRTIERVLGRRGRLLDVGCGTGYLLAAAAARGWEAQGVEVSDRAATFARATHGVDVHTGTLHDAAYPARSFDAVTLVHVLEHVPRPLALLEECRRVLVEDGVLAIAIPNPRALLYAGYNLYHRARGRYGRDRYSCSLFPPSHLYAWDAPALRRLLARAGFRLDDVVVTGKGDPERYPMVTWRGAGRYPLAQRLLETIGRRAGRGSLIEAVARPADR